MACIAPLPSQFIFLQKQLATISLSVLILTAKKAIWVFTLKKQSLQENGRHYNRFCNSSTHCRWT